MHTHREVTAGTYVVIAIPSGVALAALSAFGVYLHRKRRKR